MSVLLRAAAVPILLAAWGTAAAAVFDQDAPTLLKKAVYLQAHGTLADFHSDAADLKAMEDAKAMVLDSFYSAASSPYGHDDLASATTTLKNEARLNWDAKQFKKAVANEALYNAEAVLKFLLDKDAAPAAPNRPALKAGYAAQARSLALRAEAAFNAGKYLSMRKLLYQALWTAYPVTSRAPFTPPGD